MKLSIVIPVYNEEQRLPKKFRPYFLRLKSLIADCEIIFVDDGSHDKTIEFLNTLKSENNTIHVVHYDDNRGRGFATRVGVLEATGDYILEMDADLPIRPEYIKTFLDFLEQNSAYDFIIGSREHPKSTFVVQQPWLRVFAGKVFHIIFKLFFGSQFNDVMCGFKMFRNAVAKNIFEHVYDARYLAEAEIVYVANKYGYHIKELPIEWEDDHRSSVRVFKDTIRTCIGLWGIAKRDYRGKYKKPVNGL